MLYFFDSGAIYINYVKFFCVGGLPFSPFIYLFNNLFISVWTHGCLFILWVIIQRQFIYFVAQIVSTLATESSFSWLLCPFGILPLLGKRGHGVGQGLNISLLLAIIRFSRLIFYTSCSSPTISHFFKKPRLLFTGEWYEKPRSGHQKEVFIVPKISCLSPLN